MTKVTIETIGGKQCTVIRKPFDAEWVKEQLDMGIPLRGEFFGVGGTYENIIEPHMDELDWYIAEGKYILTILPALPKHPKPEDAKRLYEYMAEGLHPSLDESPLIGVFDGFFQFDGVSTAGIEYEITHATLGGERVEIAIEEQSNEHIYVTRTEDGEG